MTRQSLTIFWHGLAPNLKALALGIVLLAIAAFFALDFTLREQALEGTILRWSKEQHYTGTRHTVAFVELDDGTTVAALVRRQVPPQAGERVGLIRQQKAFGRTVFVVP